MLVFKRKRVLDHNVFCFFFQEKPLAAGASQEYDRQLEQAISRSGDTREAMTRWGRGDQNGFSRWFLSLVFIVFFFFLMFLFGFHFCLNVLVFVFWFSWFSLVFVFFFFAKYMVCSVFSLFFLDCVVSLLFSKAVLVAFLMVSLGVSKALTDFF